MSQSNQIEKNYQIDAIQTLVDEHETCFNTAEHADIPTSQAMEARSSLPGTECLKQITLGLGA
jgi:hypothetical protein